MSILLNQPSNDTGACVQCGNAAFIRYAGDTSPICFDCERANVVAEAAKLVGDAKALRDGTAPFHVLTVDERNEQLASLGLPPVQPSISDDRIRQVLMTYPDDRLIELVGAEPTDTTSTQDRRVYAIAAQVLTERLDNFRDEAEAICACIDSDHSERQALVIPIMD